MGAGRIAFDDTPALADPGGSGRYAGELAAALAPLLGDRLVRLAFSPFRSAGARHPLVRRAAYAARDLWWGPVALAGAARRAGAALLHLPVPVGPLGGRLPVVLTIHDLSVLKFPEYFRAWSRTYARVTLPRLARRAAAIVTVSESSRQDVIHLLDVPAQRVTVTPNGVEAAFQPVPPGGPEAARVRQRYALPERFALCVGAVEPRKNLPRLFEALAALRAAGTRLPLVHAGPPGWRGGAARRSARRLGLDGTVRFLGYVPRADLPALYSLAALLAYPSVYEGFGLPVLEAMACGCPVLTSSTSALPETAGDAALLVDPHSVTAITDGLSRLWHDGDLARDLAARGRARARSYTWERTAALTMDVYQRVLATA